VYTHAALVNSPLSFTTIAGTVVAECYAARGLVIDRGWVTAGDPVQTSVFFTPSAVCGDRPAESPHLRITWSPVASAEEPYGVDCAAGDATAGVLDCATQVRLASLLALFRWGAAESRHPHRPREDGLARPAAISRPNLADALGLLSSGGFPNPKSAGDPASPWLASRSYQPIDTTLATGHTVRLI
jgi:hypothetical protein